MTREEAIVFLDDIMTDCVYGITSDEKESCEMAIEALKQPKIIYCKDCCYWSDEDGIAKWSDGVRFARCTVHNYIIEGRHIGWCPTENDYCSYAKRIDDI